MAHMRRGAFDAAWQVSDAIMRARAGRPCWHLPRHQQYVWDGRPIDRARVLVRCYHGLGDTIQFARYAPLLQSAAASVTFWAQPPLLPLLATIAGIDRLLPLHDGSPEGDYDTEVEVMELPHVFRTTLATLPATVPYIHVPAAPFDDVFTSGSLRVGVFWRTGDWDDRRAVPIERAAILADVAGAQLCMVRRDYAAGGAPDGIVVLPGDDDLWGTARMMRGLDLVISADSMPAHLAGALGVPVWVLLKADADWRWMEAGDSSPWYPTMRLFRQRLAGDWADVMERVAEELTHVATRRRATGHD